MADFPREDWSLIIYGDVKKDMPPTCPFSESVPADKTAPRGLGFTMTVILIAIWVVTLLLAGQGLALLCFLMVLPFIG